MLAVMGFIATDYMRIPGEMYSFEAIPKTIDAHDALLKTGPMYQLLLWIGLFDILVTAPAVQAMGEGEREPGGKFPSSSAPTHSSHIAFHVLIPSLPRLALHHLIARFWLDLVRPIGRRGLQQEAFCRASQRTSCYDCCGRNCHAVNCHWTRLPLCLNCIH